MPRYDALVTVKVSREYVIKVEVTADNIADARGKLAWEAQGMTGKQIQEQALRDPESSDEGEAREVLDIFGIEEIPEDDNLDTDPREEELP